MDSRGGGPGGGRTPRGRKPRGGRGRNPESPRTPTTQQSPTVSSSSPSTVDTTPTRGPSRDEQPKVTPPTKSQPVSKIVSSEMSSPASSPATESVPKREPTTTTPETPDTIKSAEVNKPKDEAKESPLAPITPSTPAEKPEEDNVKTGSSLPPITPTSTASSAEYKTPSNEPESPKLPPSAESSKSSDMSTESKVEKALAKSSQPPATAKTLVVAPPKDVERSTDAPLSVDIEPRVTSPTGESAGGEGDRPSSSASQRRGHSRSGSASPAAFGYSLRGPLGKPGYIGGVGFSDEEGDTPSGRKSSMKRRESAIAAVETAVKGFSKRQWILLFMFGLVDMLSAITISLQAPFFPAEAERKGATATEYGFVFGIFEFVVFLTSPLYGKYINKLGPKTVFSVGIMVTSIAVICFGLLDRIEDHTTFISLCFVCRIFEALGCAGFFTATFVIIACEFPASVATTFASLETFFGLSMIVGPTVGGALYGVGGFPLPFFVVGSCLLVSALLSSFVMPKIDKVTDDDGVEQAGYGVWTILKIPSVALAAVSIASTSMSLGFVSATLEPHIRSFGLTPLQTGLVFIVSGGVYALTAPIWGYICDYINKPVYVTILGNIFIFVSFLLIGPAAFMPFDTILWVTIVGLLIQGLGFGCCIVSGFIVGLKDSMKYGLPDNMATYGVACGLWTSMISLGAWVGPTAAGILYDTVGFRQGSYLILVAALAVGIANLIHTCFISRDDDSTKEDIESQPLLRPISPLLGKKGVESESTPKPSTSSYGST